MAMIILSVLLNLVGWLIATIAAQEGFAHIFSGDVSLLEMAMAISGTTIACQVYLYGSSARS